MYQISQKLTTGVISSSVRIHTTQTDITQHHINREIQVKGN